MKRLPLVAVVVAAISAAFAAGCAGGGSGPKTVSGGSRPAWVESEDRRWPRAQHLTGVGSGDDEASAGERARAEISRVFSAAVNSDTTVEETETNLEQGGRKSGSNSQSVSQRVRTLSEKVLEGVELAERWRDPAGRWYALAVLSKGKALQAVEERTKALDAEAALWRGRVEGDGDKFERAKAGAKLAGLLKARLELEQDRRVLGGGVLPSTLDAASAKAAALRALAALDVVVALEGDGSDQVETGIVAGLAAAGLTAKRGAAGASGDMVIEGTSAVEAMESSDKRWKWTRASAIITLKEGREGKAFARFSPSEREAAGDAGMSRRRALETLAKKAAERTAASIRDYFNNQ